MRNTDATILSNRAETSAPESEPVTETSPTPDWNLDQLAAYALSGFRASNVAESEAKVLADRLAFTARASILAYFRAGSALTIAREKLKENGEWCRWLDHHNLNRKTVLTAITIFQKGKSEEQVSQYSLAEAKRKWCYDRPKTAKVPKLSPKRRPFDAHPGVPSDLSPALPAAPAALAAPAPLAAPTTDWPDFAVMLDDVTECLGSMLAAPGAAAENWRDLAPRLDELATLVEEMRRRIFPFTAQLPINAQVQDVM